MFSHLTNCSHPDVKEEATFAVNLLAHKMRHFSNPRQHKLTLNLND